MPNSLSFWALFFLFAIWDRSKIDEQCVSKEPTTQSDSQKCNKSRVASQASHVSFYLPFQFSLGSFRATLLLHSAVLLHLHMSEEQ